MQANRANRKRRWCGNEEWHLGKRPIAPAIAFEIRASCCGQGNSKSTREFRFCAKQLYRHGKRCSAPFVLQATQSGFVLPAGVPNLRLPARRFDGATASASLANWRRGRVAFARRVRGQPLRRLPPRTTRREARLGLRRKSRATQTCRSRACLGASEIEEINKIFGGCLSSAEKSGHSPTRRS